MFILRVVRVPLCGYVWQIRCKANYLIAESKTIYKTVESANRWARYWAEKLSFEALTLVLKGN